MARHSWILVAVAAASLGCDGGTDVAPLSVATPPALMTVPESTLTFLRPAPGAPPIGARTVSFWAVNGITRQGTIRYRKQPGAPTSDRLVRLKVDKRALVNRPDGTPILPGDSILITMTVVDTLRLIVDFQPSGLVFNPKRKPQITFWYLDADHDFNSDGVIDAADSALENTFQVWGEEQPGDPWSNLVSIPHPGTDQVEGRVPGFTRYAVSY